MPGGVGVREALAALPCLLKTTQSKTCNSVAKKAETLYQNLEGLIKRRGIERIAFHTLTFAENLKSRVAAQKRFNSYATNFLRHQVDEYISTVERQQRGAIHYHLVVAFPYDVRSGFDFSSAQAASACKKSGDKPGEAHFKRLYFRSANDKLAAWWVAVRDAAKSYGFGRCETLPVLTNSTAVSRYVGGYVGSEWTHRAHIDKGLRTVRYGLDQRAASVRWSWVGGSGEVWRRGCRVLSAVLGTGDFTEILGKRWAYHWGAEVAAFGRHWEKCLAFTTRSLPDETKFIDRLGFAAQMAETVLDHEKISRSVEPCSTSGALVELEKGKTE